VRLVVDAIAVRRGSAATVIGNVLRGWRQAAPEDEIVVLADRAPEFPVPDGVTVQFVGHRPETPLRRLWAQSAGLRRACRRLGADALLSAVTATAFLGAPCPNGVIVYDVRHELRPEQFPRSRVLARRVLYGWSFRRAPALYCISERTRQDLVRRRPRLQDKALATPLGADHAAGWRADPAERGNYVLAFGHFANKNVDRVLRAWQRYAARHAGLTLRVCGLSGTDRPAVESLVAELGVADRVRLMPWLTDAEFEALFAGAAAVLFPSDFEGFGLPAVEALLLGIPVVVSTDPALLEVTGGHAVVAADDRPETLADALAEALARSAEQRAAGQAHARTFTWERTARQIRDNLLAQ